jgi:acyl carrier protein
MNQTYQNKEQIERRLVLVISDVLGTFPGDIHVTDSFEDLGADSLDKLELCMEMEKTFGVSISDDELEKIDTVQNAIDQIDASLNHR